MNNGKNFADLSKESAVIGAIATGHFDKLPEKSLIPAKAFVGKDHEIIYGAGKSLRLAGVPVCAESVSDLIMRSGRDRELQKLIDPTNSIPWIHWPTHFDMSNAFGDSTRPLQYSLDVIEELYEKRETAGIAERIQSGELGPYEAIEALREVFPETRSLPPMVSAADLCLKPPPTPPEIIEGILHQGSKLALGGGSKSFKTWTLLEMEICVATGRDWLGFSTTKGRVLYVNFELPAFAMEKRIREICDAMHVEVPRDLVLWNLRGHATDAATILPLITREAKVGGFVLIVLDPLYKLLGNRDENASRDMADLMNGVERLAVDTDAAVGFGSHFAKGNASQKESMDRISGSGVFARDPDSIVTMTQHEEDKAFSVEMTLRNFAPREPFVIRREHPLMVIDGKLDPAKLKKPKGREAQHTQGDVLEQLKESMTSGEWEKACKEAGIGRTVFFELKAKLRSAGRVFQSAIDEKWSRRV